MMVIVESTNFSVVGLDSKIVETDDATLELLQCGRADVVGRDAIAFTYVPDISMSAPALANLLQTGQGFRILKRAVRADGEVFWLQTTANLVTHLQGTPFISCAAVPVDRPRLGEHLAGRYEEARRFCRFLIAGRAAFGADTFWAAPVEILLYLYREETEARGLVVDQLAHAINLATSTTIRWLRLLEKQGLVEVEDGRCVAPNAFMRITAAAEQKLDGLLLRLSQEL